MTKTRVAPVASIAAFRPGQSAWSDMTNPRSAARRRRTPRIAIQPEAKAVEAFGNRFIHGPPIAPGVARTSAPGWSFALVSGPTRSVSGRRTPCSRRMTLVFSIAPWVRMGPMEGSRLARMRCALPSA